MAKVFNFLDPKLLPKVSCKCPTTDGYEAENLISADTSAKRRGFLAYPCIRPPVELEFQFLCNVNINYIKINTPDGPHKSTGLELFTRSSDSAPYVSIAKAVHNKWGVVFHSHRIPHTVAVYEGNYLIRSFKGGTFKSFANATSLKIVIFKTQGSSVPCLESVEVWGNVSKSCSKITVETVDKLMSKHDRKEEMCCNTPTYGKENSAKEEEEAESLKIPDEFKDALTDEFMAMPMTLPCGKTIDQSTLEKHIKTEMEFFRKPCDPFTGIKFTDKCKPIFNSGLKSRIDMFLLLNSRKPETFTFKRTLNTVNNTVVDSLRYDAYKWGAIEGKDVPKADKDVSERCVVCSHLNYLYILPCGDLYCKKCILNLCKMTLKCSRCDKCFQRNEVERYHR